MPMPKGYKFSEESKRKISEALKGRLFSKEHRKKLSEAIKGKPKESQKGNKNSNWKGGRKTQRGGYIMIYMPGHPYRSKKKYVYEHRLIMEEKLGRYLIDKEIVHHINGKRDDNRLENLFLFQSNGEHLRSHLKKQKKEA